MSPNWFRWMKFEAIEWTCSLLFITFLISFPSILRRKMRQKTLGMLYKDLLDFGIMISDDFLKCDD